MKKKKHPLNFYIYTAFSLWLILAIIITIVASFITVSHLRARVIDERLANQKLYQSSIDTSLSELYSTLIDIAQTNSDILTIQMKTNISEVSLAKSGLSRQISTLSSNHKNTACFFVYIEKTASNGDYFTKSTNGTMTSGIIASRSLMRSKVLELIDSEDFVFDKWTVISMDNSYYLCCITNQRSEYVGCCIKMSDLIEPIHNATAGIGDTIAVQSDGIILTHSDFGEEQFYLPYDKTSRSFTIFRSGNKYVEICTPSANADYILVTLIKSSNLLSGYTTHMIIVLLVFVSLIVLTIIFLLLFGNYVRSPIHELYETFNKIKNGDTSERVSYDSPILEMDSLINSCNEMLDETNRLKISLYEQQLSERQTRLEYLQIQAEPHFFLNCLNLVYSLAELNKPDDIKQLSLNLSKYFRFRFHKSNTLITLGEELDHVRTYMDIQYLRYRNKLTCNIDVEEGLDNVLLPPLTIQSFVENAIKHAISMKHDNIISISCKHNNNVMYVKIQDNGKGFASDVLLVLNSDQRFENDETKRIGITNVKERLKILYGDDSYINFYNNNGSVVEFVIPIQTREEEYVPNTIS